MWPNRSETVCLVFLLCSDKSYQIIIFKIKFFGEYQKLRSLLCDVWKRMVRRGIKKEKHETVPQTHTHTHTHTRPG